jgi:choline dehydrogenase-like flavoprotein
MIEDLNSFESGTSIAFDLCIVGAGPAGIAIANELIGSGIRVCLVESGGYGDEPETQALYQGENVGHSVVMDEGRYRIFGGSATRWGGRCATLDPIDFEARDWIYKSGWPISHDTLSSFYERAKVSGNFLEPWLADAEVPKSLGVKLPAFDSADVNPFIWRVAEADVVPSFWWSPGHRKRFDWGRAYREKLKVDANTFVLLHANLTNFQSKDDGRHIDSITVSSLNSVTMTISAKAFVLCCGGIENVRLLLNAPKDILERVNAFDNLGRYLAQHPRGAIATLPTTPESADRLQHLFTDFLRPRGVQYEIGFALSERVQRERGLVNASAAIYYAAKPESAWKSGARLKDAIKAKTPYPGVFRDALNVARNGGSVAANSWRRFRGRAEIFPDPLVTILVDLEQEPNPNSRVTLSAEKDRLGMHRAKVDWRISEIERTTARYFSGFIADVLRRLGLGECQPSAWLSSHDPVRDDELYGTFHFIGSTRMSKQPHDGVVDENCCAHGVKNLYFAGCSVFPTGGHANPTLTILALAIRLADHLRTRLRN